MSKNLDDIFRYVKRTLPLSADDTLTHQQILLKCANEIKAINEQLERWVSEYQNYADNAVATLKTYTDLQDNNIRSDMQQINSNLIDAYNDLQFIVNNNRNEFLSTVRDLTLNINQTIATLDSTLRLYSDNQNNLLENRVNNLINKLYFNPWTDSMDNLQNIIYIIYNALVASNSLTVDEYRALDLDVETYGNYNLTVQEYQNWDGTPV